MNTKNNKMLKTNLWIALLLFTIFLVLAGLQYITRPYAEAEIIRSANLVLKEWNEKAPSIGKKIKPLPIGWSYTNIYQTEGKGKNNALVFIVRLTGTAGPYVGVFYNSMQTGTVFCGLAGIKTNGQKATFYGITDGSLNKWILKIDSLSQQAGAAQ